jgi:hypothetical protein
MDDVDLALLLAFDGSASVTLDEFALMTAGCAAALRDPEVAAGLVGGALGASACAVLVWSGHAAQELMIDWSRVASADDVADLAARIADLPRTVRAGTTAIGEALIVCETVLANLPAGARRRIIDIAGDGRSNEGTPPAAVRDRLVAAGVTINGLCVLHTEPDLLGIYQRDVIGGPSCFALWCQDYADFAAAMRQKLQREIA